MVKNIQEEIPRRIPSLNEKISFVRNNMSIWSFNPKDYDVINGIIIMRGFPPINEYKGIQILSINDVENLSP